MMKKQFAFFLTLVMVMTIFTPHMTQANAGNIATVASEAAAPWLPGLDVRGVESLIGGLENYILTLDEYLGESSDCFYCCNISCDYCCNTYYELYDNYLDYDDGAFYIDIREFGDFNENFMPHFARYSTSPTAISPFVDVIAVELTGTSGDVESATWWLQGDVDVIATGFTGTSGSAEPAMWWLQGDGTLMVSSGFIQSTGYGPWRSYRDYINRIVFTGPITAGTSLANLFFDLPHLQTIEGLRYFDTQNVTTMRSMFQSASSLTSLDLSSFYTPNLTSLHFTFVGMSDLRSISFSPNFVTHNVRHLNGLFSGASSLTSVDLSGFDTRNVVYMPNMFTGASSLTTIELSPNFTTENVVAMQNMFRSARMLTNVDLSSFNTSSVTNMYHMFMDTNSLESLNLSGFNTDNVWNMNAMFFGASSLTSLDLSTFNTQNVENMQNMFSWTSNLETLILSPNFTTGNVTTMRNMFRHASSLTSLDLSNFDTSSVNNMYHMFMFADSLEELDVSGFNTSNVRDMSGMFLGASSLTSLDLSNFDTRNVENMFNMFAWATNLESIELSPSFATTNVRDMRNMFRDLIYLENLDLSGFDTRSATNMYGMFFGTRSLTSLDLSGFDTRNVQNMHVMFMSTALQNLTLGENFSFIGTPVLPYVPMNDQFTGRWVNVGTGTVEEPRGTHSLTSPQLTSTFNGRTMADTWVWQRVDQPTPPVARRHGFEFEQQFAYHLDNLQPPEINSVSVEVLDFIRGIYQITISVDDCTLDPRATPFFFWQSMYGTFEDVVDDREDYATFVFRANPGTSNRNISLIMGVGDGLGQVARRSVVLKGNDGPESLIAAFADPFENAPFFFDMSVGIAPISDVTFSDVPTNHWAHAAIFNLVAHGAIGGMGDGTFRPNEFSTVEHFLALVLRVSGIDVSGFGSSGHWADSYVRFAEANNLLPAGVSRTDDITREYAFYLLYMILGRSDTIGWNRIRHGNSLTSASMNFTDQNQINARYQTAVQRLFQFGVVSGHDDGAVRPQGNITRAEMAMTLFRAITPPGELVSVWLNSYHPDLTGDFDEVFVGSTNSVSNVLGIQVFSFTVPEDGLYTISSSNNFTPLVFSVSENGGETYFSPMHTMPIHSENEPDTVQVQHHFEGGQTVLIAVSGMVGQSFLLTIGDESSTLVSNIWYHMIIGSYTIYLREPRPNDTFLEITAIDSNDVVIGYRYFGGLWARQPVAYLPGRSGGGIMVVSGDYYQNGISPAMLPTSIVRSIQEAVDSLIDIVADELGYPRHIMTNSDWTMVSLGITFTIMDIVMPSTAWDIANTISRQFTGETILSHNNNFFFVSARVQTAFIIFVVSTVAAAGSYAAATASLQAAGITVTAAVVSFAGTGGTAFPVYISLSVAAKYKLVQSGVLFLGGIALTTMAYNAQDTFNRDTVRLSNLVAQELSSISDIAIQNALDDLDDPNKRTHILQDKHNWHRLVPDPKDPRNWDQIKAIIATVMANGTTHPYKSVQSKVYTIGGEVVEVVFIVIRGVIRISDAWIR